MPDGRRPHPEVVHGISALRRSHGKLFVAVGVFDGLHLGHLYLLRELRAAAAQRGARSAVITFDHHPDEILVGAAPPLLCDPDERLELLAKAGVEVTVVQTFDAALRMTTYDDFIRSIAGRVDLAGFLMTPDAAFGHDRRGTADAVMDLGRVVGYDVVVVMPMDLAGTPVRSSEIRIAIANGQLAEASAMLGRPYAVVGDVEPRPGSRTILRFPMPVALPPAGEYSVVMGSGSGSATSVLELTAVVRPDAAVELPNALVGPGPHHVRITFTGRAPERPAALT